MRINFSSNANIFVAHQFLGNVNRNTGTLKVGTIGMPQTIGHKILCHPEGGLYFLIDDFTSHLDIKGPFEASPPGTHPTGRHMTAIGIFKNIFIRLKL